MNKAQWTVLGIGLFIVGIFLFYMRGSICLGGGDVLTACIIRRYSYVIPGLILSGLGIIFTIVGAYSSKK